MVLVDALPRSALAELSLQSVRVDRGAIRADGRLDEPEWETAPPGTGFVERTPSFGAVPPVATEVRVLHDDEAVYIAVSMGLFRGETPRALELTRDDARIWNDDAVTVKFDVERDRRTTLGFSVNAAGAQLDFLALDNGRGFRLEYDALWECGTSTTTDAWLAEFRLPFAALSLSPSESERLVGLNVSRDHHARRATYDWSPMPPEFGAVSAMHYGVVRGIEGVSGGRSLSLIPYLLFSEPKTPGELGMGLQTGGDVRFRLAPDFWSEITLLTDFAQADIDSQVVNLSRFPLQLPEKRPFFLSGLDVFDFGHPQDQAAQLFFSRRIGLDDDGRQVPILGGMKHYGRVGPLTLGLLDVVTLASGEAPAANWAVARLDTELVHGLELGGIGTMRHEVALLADGGDSSVPLSVAGGLDGSLVTAGGRLQMRGLVAGSSSDDPVAESGSAVLASIGWKGSEIQPELTALRVSDHFDPAIGFVRQPGLARLRLDLPFRARAPTRWLDEVGFGTGVSIDGSDELDRVLGRGLEPTMWLELRSGWAAEIGAEFNEEVVDEEFEIVPGVVIAPGRYSWGVAFAALNSPATGNPVGGLVLAAGDGVYDGSFRKVRGSFSLSLTRHFRFSANAEVVAMSPPDEGSFSTLALNTQATVAVSPDLFADVIAGVSSVESTGVLFLRLRWRWRPGSDVFVVYREDVSLGDGWSSERSLVLKLSARFDPVL